MTPRDFGYKRTKMVRFTSMIRRVMSWLKNKMEKDTSLINMDIEWKEITMGRLTCMTLKGIRSLSIQKQAFIGDTLNRD